MLKVVKLCERFYEQLLEVLKSPVDFVAFTINKSADVADISLTIKFGVEKQNLALKSVKLRLGCRSHTLAVVAQQKLLTLHRVKKQYLVFFLRL